MRSRPAIPIEIKDQYVDQKLKRGTPKDKVHHEMTPANKATLDGARAKAEEVLYRLKFSIVRHITCLTNI